MSKNDETRFITVDCAVSDPEYRPVAIDDNELFIARKGLITSLRPVSRELLDYYRSESGIRDRYRESWQLAVASGRTDDGLDDWIDDSLDMSALDNDDEWFPEKDAGGEVVFDNFPGLREICDEAVLVAGGEPVGTWEWSTAGFRPSAKPQIVFDTELFEKYRSVEY